MTKRIRQAAYIMSNILFNLKQDSKIPESWRQSCREAQEEFDAAIAEQREKREARKSARKKLNGK